MKEQKDLIMSLHKKYWFSHQSPKTCKLGSDGVGHDLIHDADKLQAACRNAMTALSEVEMQQEELELKQIELEDLCDPYSKTAEHNAKKREILARRVKRQMDGIKLRLDEITSTLEVYVDHIKELLPKVEARYKSYDDALSDIWMSRVAYNALVKNHPLGQDLKVALLNESEKIEVLKAMDFPTQINGNHLPIPNASFVISALEDYHNKKVAKLSTGVP